MSDEVAGWSKNIADNLSGGITGPSDVAVTREEILQAVQRAHDRWAAMDTPPIDSIDPGPSDDRNYDEEPEVADDDVLQALIDEELAKLHGA